MCSIREHFSASPRWGPTIANFFQVAGAGGGGGRGGGVSTEGEQQRVCIKPWIEMRPGEVGLEGASRSSRGMVLHEDVCVRVCGHLYMRDSF